MEMGRKMSMWVNRGQKRKVWVGILRAESITKRRRRRGSDIPIVHVGWWQVVAASILS